MCRLEVECGCGEDVADSEEAIALDHNTGRPLKRYVSSDLGQPPIRLAIKRNMALSVGYILTCASWKMVGRR